MLLDRCPFIKKIGSGQECFRCPSKQIHEHPCWANAEMSNHGHVINGVHYKFYNVDGKFRVLAMIDNRWTEIG